jgi:hypothetical protein
MAGRRFADCSGILCRPEARQEAIPAFAQYVKRMRWQRWQLEFLRCPPEVLRLLLGSFPATAFSVAWHAANGGGGAPAASACRRARGSQGQAFGALRASLTAPARDRQEDKRPGRKDGSAGAEQKDCATDQIENRFNW